MKNIKRISLILTTVFLYFVAVAHAQVSEKCGDIVKQMQVPLSKAMSVQKGMHQTLNSDQVIDKYNRHVNILVGNLEHHADKMKRLLDFAEQRGCDKLVKMMRDRINNTKNIYHEMMASIQSAAPKKPLSKQNEQLKSELDHLMEVH